jgi:pSer/pThr/pTyr-binding forkhead associated (FHA) protein
VNTNTNVTIGSKPGCDLRLEDPSVSGLHAQARLDPGRYLWVRDENSARGLHLKRNGGWVRARLVAVCVGDVLRFGDVEVDVDRITSLFPEDKDVRLAPAPAPSVYDASTGRYKLSNPDDEPTLSNPKRNADTGDLEDNS